jgi:hypothetical protein
LDTKILSKLTFFANAIWVTLIPRLAIANGTVPLHPAFSIHSTSCGEAGILALFTDACKMIRTFRISCAFRSRC